MSHIYKHILNMRNSFTSKVIAIANQKGGVGKSTITTLLANIFYFIFNRKVAIIDADHPQQTIHKRQKATAYAIRQKPKLNTAMQELYADRAPIKVYAKRIEEATALIKDIRNEYDIIFLDIAGTLQQKNLDQAFCQVHHFLIPLLQDADTLKSSLEFYKKLQTDVIPQSTVFESCHFILNNLPAMNRASKFRTAIQKEGGTILETNLPHYVIYERGFRSTLLPIPQPDQSNQHGKEISKLHELAKEIASIINLSVLTEYSSTSFEKEKLEEEEENIQQENLSPAQEQQAISNQQNQAVGL